MYRTFGISCAIFASACFNGTVTAQPEKHEVHGELELPRLPRQREGIRPYVVLIPKSDITHPTTTDNKVTFERKAHRYRPCDHAIPMCSLENNQEAPLRRIFADRPLGVCSGVMLNEKTIVTARHCLDLLTQGGKLQAYAILDYTFDDQGKDGTISVPTERWFELAQGEYNGHENPCLESTEKGIDKHLEDWAFLTPNPAPRPSKIKFPSLACAIPESELRARAYPVGGPLHELTGSVIECSGGKKMIQTTLDTFAGVSGGAVVNAAEELVGIGVHYFGSGFTDDQDGPEAPCCTPFICPEGKSCSSELGCAPALVIPHQAFSCRLETDTT